MTEKLKRPDGHELAYEQINASNPNVPTVVFCGGFRSDMQGSKALAVMEFAKMAGINGLRFDYFAHGDSGGDFSVGTIGRWFEDTLAVIDELTSGPLILVGSSMGGWIATLAAQARKSRMQALVLLAAAPDFTRRLMWNEMPKEARALLKSQGHIELPNDYSDEPYMIYERLISESDAHMVLDGPIDITCPVRLIHGFADTDVPWQLAQELMGKMASTDIEMALIKSGDHRLSEQADLERLTDTLKTLL